MPSPTLGIMALYLNGGKIEEMSYFRKLSQAGTRLGIRVVVFTPEDVDGATRTIRSWIWRDTEGRWIRERVRFPDIIYDRCRFQRNHRFQLLRKFRTDYPELRQMSRPLLHKWGIHQVLYKNKRIRPYLPETVPYSTPSALLKMLERFGLVYVKPIDGTGGRGILRIERAGDGTYRIQGRDRSRRIIAPFTVSDRQLGARIARFMKVGRFMVQQGIQIKLEDGRVHDYRLLIQKNGSGQWEVTGSAGRIGARRSITSNLHGGGSAVPTRKLLAMRFSSEETIRGIQEDMSQLAHLIANHIERQFGSMCELALDIAVDGKGRVWLIEINPKPAREVFSRIGEKETYRKAVQRPLEYALYLLKE
ncbi:YheC/YheD family endospore coat-associated protein [Gorillibacterium sp. sgz5001074]|uniref:YheC/YheD family endospore coat-associated protein n=1 Tax=Gorillibacterium sp. sgz5001074 TaxID=3446695 RepID=UPI003F669933